MTTRLARLRSLFRVDSKRIILAKSCDSPVAGSVWKNKITITTIEKFDDQCLPFQRLKDGGLIVS